SRENFGDVFSNSFQVYPSSIALFVEIQISSSLNASVISAWNEAEWPPSLAQSSCFLFDLAFASIVRSVVRDSGRVESLVPLICLYFTAGLRSQYFLPDDLVCHLVEHPESRLCCFCVLFLFRRKKEIKGKL
ncbi:hypothetical protein BHE74_00048338, partial [Ensete ventricosum]